MKKNNRVKFAIIGCGRIAYRHIEAIQANPQAELIALCDLDLSRAKERNEGASVKVYQDYRQMLSKEDIDVVNIMTPSGMHVEHALDIIRNFNKDVVIEKPMSLTVSGGLKLIEAAKEHNVRIFVVHQNRFNKAIKKIKEGIDNNLFGKIGLATIRIRWSRGQNYYDRDPWRGTWAFDGGVLTNQSIHHIDLLRWLIGEVKSVSAIGATQLVNVEVEDTACAWLKFKNGALGAVEATTTARPMNNDLEASISILAEKGTAIIEGFAVNKITTWTFGDMDMNDFSESPPNVYGFGHNTVIDNVVDVTLNGGEPIVTAEDALRSIKFLSGIYRSIELSGAEIRLEDNPVSEKLGVIDTKSQAIADLYRTDVVLGRKI